MDDQVLGQGPEVKLLGGLLVLAALRTVPRVLLAQLLRFREQAQAVLQLKHWALLGVAVPHRVVLLHVLGEERGGGGGGKKSEVKFRRKKKSNPLLHCD